MVLFCLFYSQIQAAKIYDKRDDFDFYIVNFPFLDGDVPHSTSYRVYNSQRIRFTSVSSHVADFNVHNTSLTAKFLQQGYRYHKLQKTFSKFYCQHYKLVSKFNVGFKTLLHQGLSEPEFYGDLVYKFKNIIDRADFSDQFRKITYFTNVNCTPVGRASDSIMAPDIKLFVLVGRAGAFLYVAWPTGVQLLVFFCSSVPVVLFDTRGISKCRSQHIISVEPSSLFHSIYL